MMRSTWILLVVGVLAGCTLGPDYERPDIDLPASAIDATRLSQAQEDAMAYWWTRFRDPVLNKLIDSALDDNLDIALQAARLREARAQLGLANANLFPSIEGQAQATRQKTSGAVPSSGGASAGAGGGNGGGASGAAGGQGSGVRYNYFSVAATLSYELDVFGGLRRASEAARAQLLSLAYTRDSIRLGVVSDVVTNYMSLRALERQIQVTRGTIKTREKGLDLDQKRYKFGAIDKLTLLQTRSLLETASAQLPQLQQQASQLQSSLAILTGKTPREIMQRTTVAPGSFEDVHLPTQLPAVLPSLLVERRPDIRAAEASLIAANADVGVAKARFFPTFNLSAMIGTAALDVNDLFEPYSKTESVSGAITAPIFDFGRRQARYDTALAQKQQAEISYRQTVRQAFGEVHDALVAIHLSNERLQAVQRQVDAFQDTVGLARIRYRVGRTAYFDVLDAQRQLFNSQLDLAEAIRDRFTTTANLFKALGGGWTENSDSLSDDIEATRDSYAPEQQHSEDETAAQSVSE